MRALNTRHFKDLKSFDIQMIPGRQKDTPIIINRWLFSVSREYFCQNYKVTHLD